MAPLASSRAKDYDEWTIPAGTRVLDIRESDTTLNQVQPFVRD